ncbi:MAG: hypothetical protein ABIF19_02135 [Planctomycetota bacterium]
MMKRFALIWAIAVVGLAGCQSNNITTTAAISQQPKPYASQFEYLHGVPALESVEAWRNAYGPGLKLTTAHYEILTTLLTPEVLRLSPGFIESAYRAYNSQLPGPIETQSKFKIYLFADRRQWEDFTRDFAGEQAEIFCRIKAGAYYHNGACVAYDIGLERTLSVLAHEGWHQFNGRHFKFRLPSWLDEGVAMLFEAYSQEDGTFRFDPARNHYRLDALEQTLSQNRLMPLRELIATHPGEVLATDQTEAVMAFYSQSYALLRFLQERWSPATGAAGGADAYHRLIADGLRGDWPLDRVSRKIATDRNISRNIEWNHIVGLVLFTEYIGRDFERIEKEYLDFCRQITAR